MNEEGSGVGLVSAEVRERRGDVSVADIAAPEGWRRVSIDGVLVQSRIDFLLKIPCVQHLSHSLPL